MKFTVSITLTVDPTEFDGAENSASGAIDLVHEMLKNDADWPTRCQGPNLTLGCQGLMKRVRVE